MRIFHFIKYDDQTSVDYLQSLAIGDVILCFDFEDSVDDFLVPENTPAVKAYYRKCFRKIREQCMDSEMLIPIGVRINAVDSPEYLADIDVLADAGFISTIFLPKTNHVDQIYELQQRLVTNGVKYGEIIPVIETKMGMNNLERIVKDGKTLVKNIAFGHCDYNLDVGHFPFFHQQSREYWSWASKMMAIMSPYHIGFVNSPYLQLKNDSFFKEMLFILHTLGGIDVGQVVLNRSQSKMAGTFCAPKKGFRSSHVMHTHDLYVGEQTASDFIQNFELHHRDRTFSIDREGCLLSPQEYKAAHSFLEDKAKLPEMNFTFVGGCFPVQGNICFEDLFHQKLRRRAKEKWGMNFNINIIRYERFVCTMDKIVKAHGQRPIDILAFSVRPEPYLRLVKLYYRYYDQLQGKRKWSLSLPFLKNSGPEKFDVLAIPSRFPSAGMKRGSRLQRGLRNLNYYFGSMVGNERHALHLYESLVKDVIRYCKLNGIELVILGPPARSKSGIEHNLSTRLEQRIKRLVSYSGAHLICSTEEGALDDRWFDEDGIYATEQFHEWMAYRISQVVRRLKLFSASVLQFNIK